MIRLRPKTSAQLKIYHVQSNGQTRGDYYNDGQEDVGRWKGLGTDLLGLSGFVGKTEFDQLCDNINPLDDGNLTQRSNAKRKAGYDLTLLFKKDLSILLEVYGDRRLEMVHQKGVERVLQELESHSLVTVRKNNVVANRHTHNLVAAAYYHKTTRPLDDGLPDPLAHTHLVIFSASYDPVERQWKGLQTREIYRHLPEISAIYEAEIAKQTQALGYELEQTPDGWQVKGFPQRLREVHSRRHAEIVAERKRRGISDKEADNLAALTRNPKSKSPIPQSELRKSWRDKATPDEEKLVLEAISASKARCLERANVAKLIPAPVPTRINAEERALQWALHHCLETQSVVPERDLVRWAMEYGVLHNLDVDELRKLIRSDPHLIRSVIDGELHVTTPEVLAQEKQVVAWAKQTRGSCSPLAPDHDIKDQRIKGEQQAAVEHVLKHSRDRVISIIGRAGVGKSTMIRECVDAIEAEGKNVLVVAPTGRASRGVLREDGFKEATTTMALLSDPKLRLKAKDAVLWVDESGLLSIPETAALFALAEDMNSRVILTGDPLQHSSYERGDAVRILHEKKAVETVTISEIKRQLGDYKEAVELISEGRVIDAARKFDSMGSLVEVTDESHRLELLASHYAHVLRKQQTAIVTAPTHAEKNAASAAIREKLKVEGLLGQEREFTRLRQVNLSGAQRKASHSYCEGMVLQAMKPIRGGIKTGDRLEVQQVMEGGVVVRDRFGEEKLLDVEKLGERLQCYQKDEAYPLAVGETIRITQSCRRNGQQWENGSFAQVKGFDGKGRIILTNGKRIEADFGLFEHGYVTTSMSAQGQTRDWVFVSESTESLAAADLKQWYVSMSRGRLGARCYTDDLDVLLERVGVPRHRLAAVEAMEFPLPSPVDQSDRLSGDFGKIELETERLRCLRVPKQRQQMALAM